MSYSALCKRVEDLEQDPELAREGRKSLSVPGAAIEVQLVTSCTSHKPPGAPHVTPSLASQCGEQNNTESNCSSSRLCTVTLSTSFTTSQPSKHCLNTVLCVRTLRSFSWVMIMKCWRATQLACQKSVRGNDYHVKLTVSFSLTSLWL